MTIAPGCNHVTERNSALEISLVSQVSIGFHDREVCFHLLRDLRTPTIGLQSFVLSVEFVFAAPDAIEGGHG